MKLSIYIKDQVKKFKEPYEFDEDIKIDRYEDIKRIFRNKRDKFYECTDDQAIFWQISTQRSPHFKKNILPSIKDFYPEGRGEYNQFQSYITRIAFQKWARESGFVFDINELCDDITDFGEGVLKVLNKKDEKDVKTCDLRRIFFDRTTDFAYSDKIELHELTRAEIKSKEDAWDDVDKILESQDEGKYKIYEFEGYYEDKKIHTFVYGDGDDEVIAFKENLKKEETRYIYFKLNEELSGVYQRLFVLQELVNRRVNQNDEAQAIASLLILKTGNPNVSGNVLRDAVSGTIVNDPTLQQMGIDNRALASFINEMQMIEIQADKLCMTPEVITGQELPSGTTFRGQAALTNKATSAFKSIRTKIAEQISSILIDEIFPAVTRKWENKFLEIASDDNDFKEFDTAIIDFKLIKYATELRDNGGKTPTWEELQNQKVIIKEELDTKGRKIFVDKGFFNWDFGFIYNHSNEVEDRAQQNDVYSNLMQIKMANPAMANDAMFRQWAEKNGINAVKISQEELQQTQPTGQASPVAPKEDKLMSQIDTV